MSMFLKLYIRLLLRNNRTIYMIVNVFVFFFLGFTQLLIGFRSDTLILKFIGTSMVVIVPGLFLGLHCYRLISVNYDAISVWPISFNSINKGIWKLTFFVATILYLFASIASLLIQPHLLIYLISCYLLCIGVTNSIYIYLGTLETKRFDPSLSSFSVEGALVTHPFYYNMVTFLLGGGIFLLLFIQSLTFPQFFVLVASSFGLFGLFFSPYMIKNIDLSLEKRVYRMREGFRKK